MLFSKTVVSATSYKTALVFKKQSPMFRPVKLLLSFETVVKYFLLSISKNMKCFGQTETNYYSSYTVHSKSAWRTIISAFPRHILHWIINQHFGRISVNFLAWTSVHMCIVIIKIIITVLLKRVEHRFLWFTVVCNISRNIYLVILIITRMSFLLLLFLLCHHYRLFGSVFFVLYLHCSRFLKSPCTYQ